MSSIRDRRDVLDPLGLWQRLGLPVVITDLAGVILEANDAACELLACSEAVLAGQPLTAAHDGGERLTEGALERGGWHGHLTLAPHAGSCRCFEVRAALIAGPQLRSAAIVVVLLSEEHPTHVHPRVDDFWRATIDSLPLHVAVLDEAAVIIAVNDGWRRFGRSQGGDGNSEGINYLAVCDAAGEADADRVAAGLRQILAGERDVLEIEYPCHAPGRQRWFVMRAMRHVGSEQSWVVVTHHDVTERRKVREQLSLQAALLDEVDVAVVATDGDRRIKSWNAGARRMLGWSAEETVGRRAEDILGDGSTRVERPPQAHSTEWNGEFVLQRKDGSSVPAHVRSRIVCGDDGNEGAIVSVAIDVTDQRAYERSLELAHDHLRAVTDSIGDGMFTLDSEGQVTYMNQVAQDHLGWRLSALQGRCIHELVHNRRSDGSPYPIEECPIRAAQARGEAVRVNDDIFLRPDGTEVPVSYTAAPFATADGVEGCVVLFQDISQRKAHERRIEQDLEKLSWVKRIRESLDHDGFVLYAQPIVELAGGSVVQRELLIRMRDPQGDGMIGPGAFLPVAEEYGFISEIDRWVVDRAVEIAALGNPVELNVSAASIGDHTLVAYIADAIRRTGADPTHLVFEITETTLLQDQAAGRDFVGRLHEMGCKVALDDFGTGYGGFTYLKQLPIDYLKIDIEFVSDLVHNDASRNVVEAIVKLARDFDLRTVAEGVEDEATLQLLRDLGVDYAQGYHLARPAPLTIAPAPRDGDDA